MHSNWDMNGEAWQALQQLPHLIRFSLTSDSSMGTNLCHMSALAPLAGTLQHLTIYTSVPPDEQVQQEQVVDYNALGSLTQLTTLLLPVVEKRQGLDSISRCSKLVNLILESDSAAASMVLTLLEWSSLCQLTQLQVLELPGLTCLGPRQASSSWEMLFGLQQLQQLNGLVLPHSALPALAKLPNLNYLMCFWEQEVGQQDALLQQPWNRCLSVITLVVCGGTLLLWGFPGLLELMQRKPWAPAVFEAAAQHCTALVRLCLDRKSEEGIEPQEYPKAWQRSSFRASAPAAARSAALCKLAGLQQLRRLELAVDDNTEVAALSAFQQLHSLSLIVPARSECSVRSLLMLAALRQLQGLQLELPGWSCHNLLPSQLEDLLLLLSSVRHVKSLFIKVLKKDFDEVYSVVVAAVVVMREQGLMPKLHYTDEFGLFELGRTGHLLGVGRLLGADSDAEDHDAIIGGGNAESDGEGGSEDEGSDEDGAESDEEGDGNGNGGSEDEGGEAAGVDGGDGDGGGGGGDGGEGAGGGAAVSHGGGNAGVVGADAYENAVD
jgi:hypothetical protein